MLSLRVSRDKRGYDYIYLLLEARRRGRVENRLLYCGRWPAPCRVGLGPFDDETRARLEEAHPDVPFDWATLLKTLQAALGVSRPALTGPAPPPPRSRRPPPPMPPSYGGRPGQPRRAGGPGGPSIPRFNEPMEPASSMASEAIEPGDKPEREYAATGEVLLVSADIEERESTYVAPEFEPVSEVDRSFVAAIDLELVTDQIVRIPLPEAPSPPARPAGVHVFAESSGPASFDPAAGADPDGDDSAADGDTDGDAVAASGAGQAAAELGSGDPTRPRRRRRRGGRGRGKPPDIRQSSE